MVSNRAQSIVNVTICTLLRDGCYTLARRRENTGISQSAARNVNDQWGGTLTGTSDSERLITLHLQEF